MRYKIWIAACCAVLAFSASAQNSVTPYSRVGYGMLSDNVSSAQRSMGGIGYAMQDGRTINAMNPASYSQIDSLTFLWGFGIDMTNLWSNEEGISGYSFGSGLDYINGLFKAYKHLGVSFGLVPYTSVGYSFGNTMDNGTDSHSGSGGLTQLYLGAGWEPVKGLSIGANVAYLFGTVTNNNTITSTSITYFSRYLKVRDWNAQFGVQYALRLRGGRDRLVIGATYQPKKSFHGNAWGTYYDAQDTKLDTVGYTSMKGKYQQPNSFGVGLSYLVNRRLLMEVDFTYQDWAKAKYSTITGFETENTKFDNRWKIAAGAQYCLNRRGSYVGQMIWRAGAFYNHDYLNILGNNVRDYGASVGVGIPVPNGKTTINVGFEWKHRVSSPKKLITEDYFNITLGVNINELWFWKNRIR